MNGGRRTKRRMMATEHKHTTWSQAKSDALAKAEQRVADLEAQLAAQWIPVRERLPNMFDEVWVWVEWRDADDARGDTSWLEEDGSWAMGSAKNFTVTHWQPLPAPPALERKEKHD